jgi:septum site-determining protein MinC
MAVRKSAPTQTVDEYAQRISEWRYEEDARRDPTLLVRRTLRSGQRVRYFGNVVVLGDVNPGAEITAGGDIIVMGWLRGLAHAGAGGNDRAMVSAFRLNPTQLRIGQYIGRAPDQGEAVLPNIPEFAEVRDGHLVIDRWHKSILSDTAQETHA